MEFGLSETQEMVRGSAREYLRDRDSLELARRALHDAGAQHALWQEISSFGWPGLTVDEQFGGSGLGFDDLCVLLEEWGAALAPGVLFEATVLGASVVSEFGTGELKSRLLPQVAAGEALVTLAHLERTGRWDEDISTSAEPVGDDAWQISGEKRFVPAGAVATHFVVTAKTKSGGTVCGLVAADSPAVELEPMKVASGEPYGTVRFDHARVFREDVLGPPEAGVQLVKFAQDRGAAARSVQMAAVSDAVVRRTVEYVSSRKQFGRAIGSFQAIQHRLADMATVTRGARQLARAAAWHVSAGNGTDLPVARAKSYAGDHLPEVCWNAHQLHGAIGFTWEHDLHLYTRRVISWRAEYGDSNYWKRVAAFQLLNV